MSGDLGEAREQDAQMLGRETRRAKAFKQGPGWLFKEYQEGDREHAGADPQAHTSPYEGLTGAA